MEARLRACDMARADLADKVPRLLASLASVTQEREKAREENRTLNLALNIACSEKEDAIAEA